MSILWDEPVHEADLMNFRKHMMMENFQRGARVSKIVILIELLLLAAATVIYFLRIDSRFLFGEYISMYLLMLFFNLIFLLAAGKWKDLTELSSSQLNRLETGLTVYIALVMTWGSVLTLLDQKLYGQPVAFMLNMITMSVIFLLDDRRIKVPYACSVLMLAVGLPFFQASTDIVIGHYVNLSIFVFISWLGSRMLYKNYYSNFMTRTLLEQSKILVEKEAEEIKDMNAKLDLANRQLMELALVDDLTGIPNRRSFRNFIDSMFTFDLKPETVLTFLMIDIDFFKQFNDLHGHQEADKVLIAVADQIHSMIRNPKEFVVRWGGEEFVYCAFSENTTEKEIAELTEALRAKILSLQIPHRVMSSSDFLSVSIGASTIRAVGTIPVSKGIELADQALYAAKEDGRNCVKYLRDGWAEPIHIG